jgi:hypothetical protein
VEVRTSTRPPLDVREGYSVSFIWKPVTFDRMQHAMKKFAMESSAVSSTLYHKLLGISAFGEVGFFHLNFYSFLYTTKPYKSACMLLFLFPNIYFYQL